jgi:hypothetical protein
MSNPARSSWSAVRGTVAGLVQSYRLGGQSMVRAPAILLLAALPELAQHVVEIRIGMFDSLEAAHRLQHSVMREYIGYPKVAAVWIAAFLIARFWSNGASARSAVAVSPKILAKTILGFMAIVGVGFVIVKGLGLISSKLGVVALLLSGIIQAIIFLWTIGVWLEENPISIKLAFTARAPNALSLLIIFLCSVPLAQGLHILIHKVVLGQSQPIVWALMIADAIFIVPLSAALNGAALFVGYRSGATWHGWGFEHLSPVRDDV